ncbi:uncharacterized protein LOC134539670 [Bacillus rossius redtenbacheri]|uniref:uncharacterized protein LOC134539670 n=1 Tax=Bacillus rossius redtenbacheri TaxID=93214 RepID=UPI002FDCE25E
MAAPSQQYCLRWNNHRSNLLTVFDELLRSEAFTDVTLACEGSVSVKCHKMVLAACSSYFQALFTELPCRHPVVVLKDVRYSEMKAILEYMYRGEVNVAQDQLAALLKVAQTLKVKGLVEEREPLTSTPKRGDPEAQGEDPHSPPNITTSLANPGPPPVPHSSSSVSPPHSSGHPSPVPPPPSTGGLLGACYEASGGAGPDMSPLKRKKLQSLLMSRDTPILRTVLGQGQPDSSQPMALVCPDGEPRAQFNGAPHDLDKSNVKAETYEEARSPYTDISGVDEESGEKANKIMMSQSFPAVSSGIATYVPTQKPEWKRYKQYTRNDIMSAIEAVRTGMSALQAARKYGVPSRTLYDKVKKMGITTSRPFNKRVSGGGGPGGGGPYFPYGGVYPGEGEEPAQAQPLFLQHALDGMKRELGEREARAALASAHSGASSSSPGENGRSPSPGLKYRHSLTPSPGDGDERDEDRVEDLSVSRKPEPARVIVPLLGQPPDDARFDNSLEAAERD